MSAQQADIPPRGDTKKKEQDMTEVNGTTPEFQGNPESGVDQLLNRTAPEPQPIPREMLEARIEELASELAKMTRERDRYYDQWSLLHLKSNQALDAFKEILDGDMDSEQTIKDFDEVIKALDWKLTKDVQVTVTATWSGTISMPYGTDLADISIRFQDPEIDEPNMDMDLGWGPDDYTIEED
jgi:hypothetical protein